MSLRTALAVAFLLLVLLAKLPAADLPGVVVRLDGYQGPATLVTRPLEPFNFEIAVDPKSETKPLGAC